MCSPELCLLPHCAVLAVGFCEHQHVITAGLTSTSDYASIHAMPDEYMHAPQGGVSPPRGSPPRGSPQPDTHRSSSSAARSSPGIASLVDQFQDLQVRYSPAPVNFYRRRASCC